MPSSTFRYTTTDQCKFQSGSYGHMMYKTMKVKVEHIVDKGAISDEYIVDNEYREAFSKWTDGFTRMDHPTVVQVILDKSKDKDISGNFLPNLIYVSRQKSKTSPHHFKAGALNVLLRVSAVMTNAPLILTQDCDMYSNDPQTPLRVLCYLSDPALQSKLAYIQFPQRFHGLNQTDIYASEYKRLFQINPMGFNGLMGPNYVGSGCFFCRRAFFGGPSTLVPPKIPELSPDHVVDKPINSQKILSLAHNVAGCDYENQTEHWGSKNGFRYGSLVEDFYTGYRLQSEGWKSLFCHPERAAFLGDVPITLLDLLSQCKRWCIGLLEVTFSKYNTLIFGSRSMGIVMGLAYSHYAFWPIWCIPITLYSFLPQLALLNKVNIFPKVSEPWCFLYVFLFLGAYGQDFLDFVLAGGTVRRWWNAQRMWMIRGLSCFLFSSIEYLLKSLGISTHGFSLTSKVLDDEQSKRYGQSIFEFGVPSPLFVPLTMTAIINLFSFAWGLTEFWDNGSNKEGLALQMVLTGFIVLNCLPIYGAIALRSDKGKMPTQITIISTFLSLRVSAIMTNAPLILTQDCDMYSNDPQTPLRVLCYLTDPALQSKLAYIQFPQRFHGLNQTDIYASEYKCLFQINPMGFNGLMGPNYVGSGCFFCRRAFFGGPSTLVPPKIPELNPDHVVDKPINSQKILSLAHNVAGCDYENQTEHWGSKNGFRYGSLVEDFYTGYRLQSEGWKSLFCHPERAAFLGDVPITLLDLLSQCKRWCIGLLEVTFSKYNTLIFGSRSMGIVMGLAYSHYAFWPIWCIPITLYSFLPQLALLNKVSIFPKVSEPWCFLYFFLFLGAYGQDFLDFVLAGGTVRRWWNAQRMWMIRGLSCFLFSSVEYLLKSLGISTHGFSLTSKVLDDEQSKRYGQSIFEFGVPSPLFVPLTMAAIINLFSFAWGLTEFWDNGSNKEGLALQMVLAGFIVLNCLPIYGAIALRSDKGKMPTQITVISTFLSVALYIFAYLILKQ
ncbi:Cellulose synthase - like 10 [Theobroma cacao]|nr:Cellulose synthase - like 10 [Theobroma cacao]